MGGQNRKAELLEQEAHRWITMLISGEATAHDAEALKRWCTQSPSHASAFADATRRWKDFGLAGSDWLEGQVTYRQVLARRRMNRRAIVGGAGALAAAAASYAIVSPPFGLWPSLEEWRADYRTVTGEQRKIVLAGDVSVQMNTQSSIAFHSANDAYGLKLIAGEASFLASSQMQKPLVVFAADGRTLASRARFDVRNLQSDVCVTCLEGEVRVEQGTEATIVGANRQVRYGKDGLAPPVTIDPVQAAAWQNGVLIFRLTPLTDVIAEINRYRPGKVILINASLARRTLSGRFHIQNMDEVLVWVEQALDARSRSLPGGIVLLG
ncbi:MAG TPA: FecR domain-containing protein [Bradyrhizobium sp.]|nr:FecR domain-containing protein [Bradyrhizobium sp.]